eukprot:105204-Chlamydomonas_euryale.AAC.1
MTSSGVPRPHCPSLFSPQLQMPPPPSRNSEWWSPSAMLNTDARLTSDSTCVAHVHAQCIAHEPCMQVHEPCAQ